MHAISMADPRTARLLPIEYLVGAFILLALLLLPRLLTVEGERTIVNLLNYPMTFVLYLMAIVAVTQTTKGLHARLAVMLVVMWASALYNSAGLINVFIEYLLLCQPFMIIVFMASKTWGWREIKSLEWALYWMVTLHAILAYFQAMVTNNPDEVKGLFLGMGAGHHVGGAVALSAAVYFALNPLSKSFVIRWFIPLLVAGVVIISDSKQVVLVFGLSLGILVLISMRDVATLQFRRFLRIVRFAIIPAILIALVTFLAIPEGSRERVLRDSEDGFALKFSVFSIFRSYQTSDFDMVLGLGPGHTTGRLGWMFPSYQNLLLNLGGTHTNIADRILFEDDTHYLTNGETGSSLYSMKFSWAGIWGDLGFLGVFVYFAIWLFVWRRFCKDQLSRYFVINVLLFGIVFAWLEEPAYMGVMAMLIGLRMQKERARMRLSSTRATT